MVCSEIAVEKTATGGRRLTVYGSCTSHFAFEPVRGDEKTLREDHSLYPGNANEDQQNIGFAYRQATKKLQELGFRIEHPPHRYRHIR